MYKTMAETKAMLLKPLFVDGMFNKSGKRSRFTEAGDLGKYRLYKNNYLSIYAEVNDYLVYIGTEENFENYTEEQLITNLENFLKRSKDTYLQAKENSDVFPDFIGACIVGELSQAFNLSEAFKAKKAEKERQKQIEREKQEKAQKEKEQQEFNERISKVKKQFKGLGKIDDIDAVIGLAEKLGVNIPLRTKGWMMESLVSVTLREEEHPDGEIGYSYIRKTKNSRGSQAVFTVIRQIRDIVLGL